MNTLRHSETTRQNGAALLTIMLMLVVASSYVLLRNLNDYVQSATIGTKSFVSLNQARAALIAWAVNHPTNPGSLPMPDRNGDGDYDGDADCSNGVIGNNLLIGRMPWRGYTSPCKDAGVLSGIGSYVADASGEVLWYAVSKNLVYESPSYPVISPVILDQTSGWITVRDPSGAVISDRVAFVLIAPGPVLNNQDRAGGAPNANQYLDAVTIGAVTYDNSDTDQDFIMYPNSNTTPGTNDNFNDLLVFVTIDELMAGVSNRVLNEASNVLAGYHGTYGAVPWLSPFADPRAVTPFVSGTADAASNSLTLVDSAVDFSAAGIAAGDRLVNVSDGSMGLVASVSGSTLTVASLILGNQNDFDSGEEYYIVPQSATYVTNYLAGTATSGSTGLTMENSNRDFGEIGIRAGDIIVNAGDGGSAGVVVTVASDELTVKSLAGGTNNDFGNGDTYRIRSTMGFHAGASSSTILTDTTKDFSALGVVPGDVVFNYTDASVGRVITVGTATLTVEQLYFGSDNDFDANDVYTIPRFNQSAGTTRGLLAFHDPGEYFSSGFTLDWNITVNAGDVAFDTTTFPNASTTYRTALTTHLNTYAVSGTETFTTDSGTCRWLVADIAECRGWFDDFVNISGRLTSGFNTNVITDSSAEFVTDGVKRGDIAQNYDDESFVLSGTVDAGSSGTATAGSNNQTLEDTANNFLNVNVAVGDTIFNTTDNSSGTIISVSANQITVAALSGGTNNTFSSGNRYRIDGDPVLYDAAVDFSPYQRYSYVVQNNTLETEQSASKIQGVIADRIDSNTIVVGNYDGESTIDIEFRPGDNYAIYQPQNFVVSSTPSVNTQVYTTYLTSATAPDFDSGEYYRIKPAASFTSGTISWTWCSSGSLCTLTHATGDFLNKGITVGDVVRGRTTGGDDAWGLVTSTPTATTVTARLYGNLSNPVSSYAVYYDHVYSRRHEWHARFSGNQATKAAGELRVRDVCHGYNASCTSLSAAAFSGNGGTPLVTVRDYEEDGTTEVGRGRFTPTSASSGSLRVANIDYYLNQIDGDLPEWLVRNHWYQYIYIVYSDGDMPGGGSVCTGANCLTLNLFDNQNNAAGSRTGIRAVMFITANELTGQDWANAASSDYFDSTENIDTDNIFERFFSSGNFNDRVRIATSCPTDATRICWSQ